jgi:hypothetical protein
MEKRQPYPTDLTEQQWNRIEPIEPLIPAVKPGGRPRYPRRESGDPDEKTAGDLGRWRLRGSVRVNEASRTTHDRARTGRSKKNDKYQLFYRRGEIMRNPGDRAMASRSSPVRDSGNGKNGPSPAPGCGWISLLTCVCGALHDRVRRALLGRETLRGVPLDSRRVQALARGSLCDSRDYDRRVHRNDPTRDTKAPPRRRYRLRTTPGHSIHPARSHKERSHSTRKDKQALLQC